MTRGSKRWNAFLRVVNVGGRNKLPMKELVHELEALGFTGVKTYIQSGNVILASPAGKRALSAAGVGTLIATCIHKKFGFQPGVMVVSKEQLATAASSNPFREGELENDGRTLHFFFLGEALPGAAKKDIDRAALDRATAPGERWSVVGSVFYLHTPNGFGTSQLAAKAEQCLGVPATARNWRTVRELLRLAGSD
jgi:uncharacterized protein (DUF1697 family)